MSTSTSTNIHDDKHSQSWVAFTATAKAYQPQLSPTLEHHQHGSRLPRSKWWTRSASSRRRARPRRRLVWCLGTRMVLLRSRSSLVSHPLQMSLRVEQKADTSLQVTRSSAFSSPMVRYTQCERAFASVLWHTYNATLPLLGL